jgi:hypothetical protein
MVRRANLAKAHLIVLVALAALFSSLTLWLLDSWIKFPLYVFEIIVILLLYSVINNYNVKVIRPHFTYRKIPGKLFFSVLLIVLSFFVLFLNIFNLQVGIVQLIVSLLITSFLPGYLILNISNLSIHFSKLEELIFSFILSFLFSGLLTLAFLFLASDLRLYGVMGVFIVLGVISLLKLRNVSTSQVRPKSFARNIDFFVILVALAFLALSFCFIYPNFALLPNTDISRTYATSIQLWRTPALYISPTEVLSNLHESLFIALSDQSLVSIQVALLMLNFMLPLAFYIMAKTYLEKIDSRIPSIATLFWVLFTNGLGGFSWIYFAYLKLTNIGQNQLQLLTTTADKTLNGTIYGIIGLWYIPATISFVVLIAAIFLLRQKEMPTIKYAILFSAIITTMFLTHIAEAIVLTVFLSIYGILSKNDDLKINAALKGSILGFVLSAFAYFILSILSLHLILDSTVLISMILPTILLVISLIMRHSTRNLSFINLRRKFSLAYTSKLMWLVLFSFVTALLAWFSLFGSFSTSQVDNTGVVPWFIYPLVLGITGLLTMITLYFINTNAGPYKPLRFFVALLAFVFLAGTLVSFFNLYVFNLDYWEKRFVWIIKLSLALLSPIPILLFVDKLKTGVSINFKKITSIVLIGIICLYGVSTTFLNVEYWNITTGDSSKYPSSLEQNAINAYKNILKNDPFAWSATVTDTSASMTTFAAPSDMLLLKQLLYATSTPEMVLSQLYRNPVYSHPYIYVDNRDSVFLNSYSDDVLAKYLLPTLPKVFENSEVSIYNVSKLSFPQATSGNALLIPYDKSIENRQSGLLAYYALSYGQYNYTTEYDIDNNALNNNLVILPFDPPQDSSIETVFQEGFNKTLSLWTSLSGVWNIDNARLLGANPSQSGEASLLSSVSAENFSATVTATPISGNSTLSNYMRFIYSWVDAKNYRIADVLFNNDGYIYFLFRNIVKGVESAFPQWPGLKTDLKWSFNKDYYLTLSVNGSLNKISIGNSSLSVTIPGNHPGKIGLGYYRFANVAFENFSAHYSTVAESRTYEQYIKYLNSGGELLIIDTSGENIFSKELFSPSNETLTVQSILTLKGDQIDLLHPILVPIVNLRNNVTIINKYMGLNNSAPLSLQKNYENGGRLIFVNANPLVNAMFTNNQSSFYSIFSHLLDCTNIPKLPMSTSLPSLNGYVKQIDLNSTQLETTSIIFPQEFSIKQAQVTYRNTTNTFHNVTDISVESNPTVLVKSDAAEVKTGTGFYTTAQFKSNLSIEPLNAPMNLVMTTVNGSYKLENVDSLTITPNEELNLLLRTPTVTALGVNFTELYLQNYSHLTTKVYGQDLTVKGATSFNIIIADNYQAIGNLSLGHSLYVSGSISSYNVLSTLPTALFWSLVLLPIFVLFVTFFEFRKFKSNIKQETDDLADQ